MANYCPGKVTATRLGEVHLLELAEAELAGKCVWNYGQQPEFAEKQEGSTREVPIGGAKILVYFDADVEQYLAADTSRSRQGKGKAHNCRQPPTTP